MRTLKLNKNNIEQVFEKAIGRIEREIGIAIACYRWAQTTDYDSKWTEAAGRRLTRALGVSIDDFQATAYTCGNGDLDVGCDRIQRFGAGRLDDARKSLARKDLAKLLDSIDDSTTPEQFDQTCRKLVTVARRRASEAGRRLRDARRGLTPGQGKIAGQIVDYRQAYETTKALLEQEKQRRRAAEKRAEELQRTVEQLTDKLVAVS